MIGVFIRRDTPVKTEAEIGVWLLQERNVNKTRS